MKRLLMATLAMIVAVGWAGAATAAAQTQDDTDFGGGTHAGTAIAAPDDLALSPAFDDRRGLRRDGAAGRLGGGTVGHPGGTATVAGGTLTVDGARANTTAFYDSGRSLDFAATFTADPFQHVGFGVAFEDPPWAMFSTGGGALPWASTPEPRCPVGRRRTRRSQASIRSSSTTTASSGPRPRSGTSSTATWW